MHSVVKVGLMEKIHCVHKPYDNSKLSLFVVFDAKAESVNCFLFLKKSRKTFLKFGLQKKLS